MTRILPGLVAAAATVAAAAGAASATTLRAAGPVEAVATAGAEVAYADEYRRGCHEVLVWNTARKSGTRYGSQCFEETSTGSGVAAVAVAGGRALWLTYTGGNIREWTLWTRTATSKARRIRFVARDVDAAAPPIRVGTNGRDLLVYAVDRTVVGLSPSGKRRFAWTAPAEIVFLTAQAGAPVVVLEDGRVFDVAGGHETLRGRADGARAAYLTFGVFGSTALLVHEPGRLVGGSDPIALPAGAVPIGYADGRYAFAAGGRANVVSLHGGGPRAYGRAGANGRLAAFGGYGLVTAAGRTITLTPAAALAR